MGPLSMASSLALPDFLAGDAAEGGKEALAVSVTIWSGSGALNKRKAMFKSTQYVAEHTRYRDGAKNVL